MEELVNKMENDYFLILMRKWKKSSTACDTALLICDLAGKELSLGM